MPGRLRLGRQDEDALHEVRQRPIDGRHEEEAKSEGQEKGDGENEEEEVGPDFGRGGLSTASAMQTFCYERRTHEVSQVWSVLPLLHHRGHYR